MQRRPVYVWLAMVGLLLTGCGPNEPFYPGAPANALPPLSTIEAELAGRTVVIELAITPQEQRQGLMYRESMPDNHGMLFVYRQPQYMSFWMKNTKIPLSIAFIREDGIIGNIEDMEPHTGPFDPVKNYRSTYKSLYALEMNQGWFDTHGLNAGERIELPYGEIQSKANDAMGLNSIGG